MIKRFRKPLLALVVTAYMSLFVTSPALAGMVSSLASSPETAATMRGEEIGKIQRVLENRIVVEKFKAYGLNAEEIRDKLQSMSDEQIHLLAQASDQLPAGGDGWGFVIGLLLVILLVLLILKLYDKQIVIK
ncbi:MAG TPA: PA2779 family protein [Syntrophales bacterium]|jgi:hypothetical protein|nr:PA2779 family protein [Syntrophales bacterium]HRT60906.1 PA2779 family protein [Syntrophales bacterium]